MANMTLTNCYFVCMDVENKGSSYDAQIEGRLLHAPRFVENAFGSMATRFSANQGLTPRS